MCVGPEAAAALRRVATDVLATTGARTLNLAGPELALAPEATWRDLAVIDCTRLHIEAILTL